MLVYRQVAEDASTASLSQQQLLAALPLYLKYHSQGEFIFDHQWANFAETVMGIRYYPKLLAAVPMTPATGSRVLILQSLTSAGTASVAVVIYYHYPGRISSAFPLRYATDTHFDRLHSETTRCEQQARICQHQLHAAFRSCQLRIKRLFSARNYPVQVT